MPAWQLHFTRRRLARPAEPRPLLTAWDPDELDRWLDAERVPDGRPFLLGPDGTYDVDLNRYFEQPQVMGRSPRTWAAIGYDLKNFLDFLWAARQQRSWRDATVEDRGTYLHWRRRDVAGPHVAGATWDREVATVNGFYRWAVAQGLVAANPIAQRPVRGRRHPDQGRQALQAPAERSHDARRHKLAWLTPAMYRTWRDVGIRGYGPDGLADPTFRGRTAARNSAFTDLMLRTGLRLSEQASLTVFELPDLDPARVQHPFWLPPAVAKGGSARTVYVPSSALRAARDYVELERAEAVEQARAAGRYDQLESDGALVVTDPTRPQVKAEVGRRRPIPVAKLGPDERLRLLVRTPDGLEPAALWLREDGLPAGTKAWQSAFRTANQRCARHGLDLACHPHALRHSYAVITLEQLQRGHLRDLERMLPVQRRSYQMVFGDPLNWLRLRLGHASVESTLVYLHVLGELELATRMALVPDHPDWDVAGSPTDVAADPADDAGLAGPVPDADAPAGDGNSDGSDGSDDGQRP